MYRQRNLPISLMIVTFVLNIVQSQLINPPIAKIFEPKMGTKNWDSQYDYIIVGGGTAGAVLANRLSADASAKVLLLEAGGNENILSDIPLVFQILKQTQLDWNYLTEPQESACYGLNNRVHIIFHY